MKLCLGAVNSHVTFAPSRSSGAQCISGRKLPQPSGLSIDLTLPRAESTLSVAQWQPSRGFDSASPPARLPKPAERCVSCLPTCLARTTTPLSETLRAGAPNDSVRVSPLFLRIVNARPFIHPSVLHIDPKRRSLRYPFAFAAGCSRLPSCSAPVSLCAPEPSVASRIR